MEHDHQQAVFGQHLHGPVQAARILGRHKPFGRPRIRPLGALCGKALRQRQPPPPSPMRIHELAVSDPMQPCPNRPAPTEVADLHPSRRERLLCQVFGKAGIACHVKQEAVDTGVIGLDQTHTGLPPACANLLDQTSFRTSSHRHLRSHARTHAAPSTHWTTEAAQVLARKDNSGKFHCLSAWAILSRRTGRTSQGRSKALPAAHSSQDVYNRRGSNVATEGVRGWTTAASLFDSQRRPRGCCLPQDARRRTRPKANAGSGEKSP